MATFSNANLPGGRMHHPNGFHGSTSKPATPYQSSGAKGTDHSPRNNSALPGEGTITRQRARASVREAAYVDAQETFKNAPRRVRRAMARKSVSLVVHMQKGKQQ